MNGSLIVVGFFALGCLLGWGGWLPDVILENDITVYVLYLLMFQVGLSIGSDKKLKEILGSIRPKLLLIPFATIAGTLVFSALASLYPARHRIRNDRFNGKYHARDYGPSRYASFCPVFWQVVPYLCRRGYDDGYDFADHHPLFGERPCFYFNFSWDYCRFHGSVLCVVLLFVVKRERNKK